MSKDSVQPVVGGYAVVAKMLSCSTSTVRRLVETDPTFPAPYRDRPGGDPRWYLPAVEEHVRAKAEAASARKTAGR